MFRQLNHVGNIGREFVLRQTMVNERFVVLNTYNDTHICTQFSLIIPVLPSVLEICIQGNQFISELTTASEKSFCNGLPLSH